MNTFFQGLFDTETTSVISVNSFLLCMGVALLLGIFLAFAYSFKSRYTQSFLLTMSILPAIVCVMIMMVNGNVGTGVAVAGVFSLVRFRSVPGTAKEIAAIFLAMAAGLICGMGYLGYAALFSVILGIGMMAFSTTKLGGGEARTLIVTIPENLDFADVFDDIFTEYTNTHSLVEAKSTNMGSLFKLTYHVTLKDAAQSKEMMDAIRTRNGNLDISLVRGTDAADVL